MSALPDNLEPSQFAKLAFWYAEADTCKRIKQESGVTHKTFTKVLQAFRKVMYWFCTEGNGANQLGGPGRIVCVDETYFTKKKNSRSGFRGRTSQGHQVCILGMVEIDMTTRTETGNIRLIQIAGPTRTCIQQEIERHVIQGSLIFTDSHRSYAWLTQRGCWYAISWEPTMSRNTRISHVSPSFPWVDCFCSSLPIPSSQFVKTLVVL